MTVRCMGTGGAGLTDVADSGKPLVLAVFGRLASGLRAEEDIDGVDRLVYRVSPLV